MTAIFRLPYMMGGKVLLVLLLVVLVVLVVVIGCLVSGGRRGKYGGGRTAHAELSHRLPSRLTSDILAAIRGGTEKKAAPATTASIYRTTALGKELLEEADKRATMSGYEIILTICTEGMTTNEGISNMLLTMADRYRRKGTPDALEAERMVRELEGYLELAITTGIKRGHLAIIKAE